MGLITSPDTPTSPKCCSHVHQNDPEPLEFSAQLRKKPELLRKEQKQRQSRRCLVSVESHRSGAAPPGPLLASSNQQCESFVLSGARVGASSPSSGTKLLPRRKVSMGETAKRAMWPPWALKICNQRAKKTVSKCAKVSMTIAYHLHPTNN